MYVRKFRRLKMFSCSQSQCSCRTVVPMRARNWLSSQAPWPHRPATAHSGGCGSIIRHGQQCGVEIREKRQPDTELRDIRRRPFKLRTNQSLLAYIYTPARPSVYGKRRSPARSLCIAIRDCQHLIQWALVLDRPGNRRSSL